MGRLLRRRRDDQRLGVRQPHVLAREDDDAPRDEHWVLARVDHPHQPVERRVGIAAAHALDERADGVVMLVAGAVVQEAAPLQRLAHVGERDLARPGGGVVGQLERVQRDPRVAVRHRDERVLGLLRQPRLAGQAALVDQRAPDDRADVVLRERAQHVHARTRQQRRDHLERGVLGRGAQERDVAVLDVRQHDVLLGLVEAVDLVDEQDRALPAHLAKLLRVADDLSQLGHSTRHRGDVDELRPRLLGRYGGERGLPRAGRAPQDHRRNLTRVDRLAQHAALADDVLLTDELRQVDGPHPRG